MRKSWITLAAILSLSVGAWAADHSKHHHGDATTQPASTQQSKAYVCPMHCTDGSDQPGNCPVCGMKLKKADATTQPAQDQGKESHTSQHEH